jgi:hypothetical protein
VVDCSRSKHRSNKGGSAHFVQEMRSPTCLFEDIVFPSPSSGHSMKFGRFQGWGFIIVCGSLCQLDCKGMARR